MDLLFSWSKINTTTYKGNKLLGVDSLNLLSNNDFLQALRSYVNIINFVDEKCNKYDIDNSIFSPLQRSPHLNKDKYELLSKLRHNMWISNDHFMSVAQLDALFS